MEELLNNPAVQAGVLPFVAALVLAGLLRRTRHVGLAIAAAFLVAVGLTMGFGFESLTSVKKLVLAGAGAAVGGVLLEVIANKPRWPHRLALLAALALAVLWVLQRILMQREGAEAAIASVAAVAYGLAMLPGAERVSRDPVRASAAALVLALASGALALLGASAQLAQLGIALGAGAGAVLLVQMLGGAPSPVGWTLGLCAQVGAALIGLLAVFTGSLPWFCLLPLPLIAWAAAWAPAGSRPVWQRAFITAFIALIPALAAIALAWRMAGGSAA
ncbi:MAG TPA: hypothetical protein VLI46_12415 [Ramlibacter sp.]|nr:hypothetical protein [Ramlibacter sp.]